MVTDAYLNEPVAFGDGTTPIRLIDLDAGQDATPDGSRQTRPTRAPKASFVSIHIRPGTASFDVSLSMAAPAGTRRVYVADLTRHPG